MTELYKTFTKIINFELNENTYTKIGQACLGQLIAAKKRFSYQGNPIYIREMRSKLRYAQEDLGLEAVSSEIIEGLCMQSVCEMIENPYCFLTELDEEKLRSREVRCHYGKTFAELNKKYCTGKAGSYMEDIYWMVYGVELEYLLCLVS